MSAGTALGQTFQALNVDFAFAAVVINAVFVILVLSRTSRTEFYLTFLFMCVSAAVWNFGIFMTYFAGRGFWFYFALIGSPMMPALLFHFIHALTRPTSRSVWTTVAPPLWPSDHAGVAAKFRIK